MVCLVFIFLTPKGWFENGERRGVLAHQNPVLRTLILEPEVIENESDKSKIEQVIRSRTGRSDVKVLRVEKLVSEDGRILGFEVDIQ